MFDQKGSLPSHGPTLVTQQQRAFSFLVYQVKGRIGLERNSRTVGGHLASPASVFREVDLKWWSFLRSAGLFEGELEVDAPYPVQAALQKTGLGEGLTLEERQALSKAFKQYRQKMSHLSGSNCHPAGFKSLAFGLQTDPDSLDEGPNWIRPEWERPEWELLAGALAGRFLLLDEVKQAYQAYQLGEGSLETLQWGYLQGFFNWEPSLRPVRSRWLRRLFDGQRRFQCSRCGSQEVVPFLCERCGSADCAYCPHCLALGRVRACEPMLRWATVPIQPTVSPVELKWQGTLSPWQQKASRALVQFVKEKKEPAFLVWAVCGAGKTEMLFEMLSHVLNEDKRVLITAPRRDVILELAPRLKEAFPAVTVSALYGGSPDRYTPAQLVLATTHQVLRFYRHFDLVVIDEEDAFPYHHDPMLPLAVNRAKTGEAQVIYLTATPRPEMKREAQSGRLPHVTVPRRFHGQPLAVPRIRPVGRWRKKMARGEVITPLVEYLLHLLENKRYGYLFVPQVGDLELVSNYIKEVLFPFMQKQSEQDRPKEKLKEMSLQDFTLAEVHAHHPKRDQIVRRFRQHQIRLLMTTTILERGVTIAYSDVAVLGADDPLFDSAALIQMAGRTGRKAEDPKGLVWFLPEMRTRSQLEAIREIKAWNRLNQ